MRHDAMAFCWRTQWAQFCFNALFCDSKIAICSLSLASFFYVKDILKQTLYFGHSSHILQCISHWRIVVTCVIWMVFVSFPFLIFRSENCRDKQRQRDFFLLVHSLIGCSVQGQVRKQEVYLGMWQEPKHLDHFPVFFPGHQQGTESEVAQLGLELGPIMGFCYHRLSYYLLHWSTAPQESTFLSSILGDADSMDFQIVSLYILVKLLS